MSFEIRSAACLLLLPALLSSVCSAPAAAQPADSACLERQARGAPDDASQDARERSRAEWIDLCQRALARDPQNEALRVAAADAFSASGKMPEALEIWRALGRGGHAPSLLRLYDAHKSTYRVPGREQLVKRDEAEGALRRAADLAHPPAMWTLAVLLDRGSTVKRDPIEAIAWAERALQAPPPGTSATDIEVRLGHFLAKSPTPEARARGIAILSRHAPQRGDAKAYLAMAVRATDPVRARGLLEPAVKDAPGHAIPVLAQMLIAGEGGKPDPAKAVKLLTSGRATDVGAVRATLGRLMLEGKHVPLNVQEGIRLVRLEAVWSTDTQVELMRLLAAHPTARIERPEGVLYDALEAADLDEPQVLDALLGLKLSQNAQFRDPAGACKLAAEYAGKGRTITPAHRAAC